MQIILACNGSLEVNCQNQCNIHCINKTCNKIDGSCLYGCLDGHQCVDGIFLISIRFLWILFMKKAHNCNEYKVTNTLDKQNDTNDIIMLYTLLFRFSRYFNFIFIRQFTCDCWRNGLCFCDCSNWNCIGFVCNTVRKYLQVMQRTKVHFFNR